MTRSAQRGSRESELGLPGLRSVRPLMDAVRTLRRAEIPHVLIGAMAMAVHGQPRATADIDLLVATARCLDNSVWAPIRKRRVVMVRRGDPDDPLVGIVRLSPSGPTPVDVVVPRGRWVADLVARTIEVGQQIAMGDETLAVTQPADLVLLKLYAGSPLDQRDIFMLLGGDARAAIIGQVDRHIGALPPDCAALWQRLRGEAGAG